MPASTVRTDEATDRSEGDGSVGLDEEPASSPTVHDYLEMALEAATEQEMSTSELMGIFFYYAHSIAESYRQEAIREQKS